MAPIMSVPYPQVQEKDVLAAYYAAQSGCLYASGAPPLAQSTPRRRSYMLYALVVAALTACTVFDVEQLARAQEPDEGQPEQEGVSATHARQVEPHCP